MELFMKYPHDVQKEIFTNLIQTAKNTEWGEKYHFSSIKTYKDFKNQVPISAYEDIYPYIERIMKGEQNILWPSEITWFAKSSGTTNARSKFIPVSPESLEECHFKAGKDLFSIYANNVPETKLFTGKNLAVGGSHQINHFNSKSFYGDVSAVIMANLPFWAQFIRTPSLEIALLDKWEEKIEKLASATIEENVTAISGVPTWTILILKRILELTGKKDITEVWPNLELFIHGAVSFSPYKSIFKELIPSRKMNYLETYNASEGFFGIQDQLGNEDLLLMLDYGVYYEFIPMEELDSDNPKVKALDEVELGKNYALLISTNAGLWRYKIGDTVKFTSLNPYRIRITGRTKHYINAFGEELIVENADTALSFAAEQTGAILANYTAAPMYLEIGKKGGHEWIIEFEKEPQNKDKFILSLDEKLREINSDYDAKRQSNLALIAPKVHFAPKDTFYNWMKNRGKLGGQNKVPRLSNNREFIDAILELIV
jgi:hypothetical protein